MNDETVRAICSQEFEFLEREFGMLVKDLKNVWGMSYRSALALVYIEFDKRSLWLDVGIIDPDPARPKQYAAMSLTSVVAYYCGCDLPLTFPPRHLWDDGEHLRWMATEYAKLLRRYAGHLLRGDFADAARIGENAMRLFRNDVALSPDERGSAFARQAREHPVDTNLFWLHA